MPGLRMILLLLALLSCGFAQASQAFDDAPRASDEELDRMRGGFVVNLNGMEFLLPFSIDGIERLTQIGGQTFINGEPISPRLNVQALTPLTQVSQALAGSPDPASGTPAQVVPGAVQPAVAEENAMAASGANAQSTSGSTANPASSVSGTTQTPSSGTPAAPSSSPLHTQVTTQGSLIVIQNGAANSITLPLGVSPDSLATIIQNSVNDQVIRNITTLNIAVEAQMLAAQARLNAIAQSLRGLR